MNHDGRILLNFDNPDKKWVPLVIREKKGVLMLYREDGRSVYPEAIGPDFPKENKSSGYWPFREPRKGTAP